MTMLEVRSLQKVYTTRFGGASVQALNNVSFSVDAGEFLVIMGESGSGKTTLLNILAALDKPTAGQVLLEGQDMTAIPDGSLAAFRRDNLGFIFQDFNLLDNFSVRDNILLPLVLAGKNYQQMEPALTTVAARLGIGELLDKFPYEISGGQKQRTACARAIITNPRLVLADEPTGALDSRSAASLMSLFGEINLSGQTIIMVTHSVEAASHGSRVLFIRDGSIYHQLYRGHSGKDGLYQDITATLARLAAEREAAYGQA